MGLTPYSRCAFKTHLPDDRVYVPSHHWLQPDPEAGPGVYRVGLTTFATRMLGEAVEIGFEVELGGPVELGAPLGWVEGFKAITELYAPVDGTFVGANPALADEVEALTASPFYSGWMYRVAGELPDHALDLQGYMALLDGLIDRLAKERK